MSNDPVPAHTGARCSRSKPQFFDECLTVFHGWDESALWLDLDPGMRDYWVTGFPEIIDAEIKTDNQVGTMIWAWVDDEFLVPGKGIGYWRRSLPPIRYADADLQDAGPWNSRRRCLGNDRRLASPEAGVVASEEALLGRPDRGEASRRPGRGRADRREE